MFSEELKAAHQRFSATTAAETGPAIVKDNIGQSLRSLVELCLQDRIDFTH